MAKTTLKTKTDKELTELLGESRTQLHSARMKAAERQLKNVQEIKLLRRTIARALTEERARQETNRT